MTNEERYPNFHQIRSKSWEDRKQLYERMKNSVNPRISNNDINVNRRFSER